MLWKIWCMHSTRNRKYVFSVLMIGVSEFQKISSLLNYKIPHFHIFVKLCAHSMKKLKI